MMDRRAAVARLAAITGAAVIGAESFLSGCARLGKKRVAPFTSLDVALLDDIGDTILPTTDTPGAKAVGIGAFMVMMVNDCYDNASHAAFQEGLEAIQDGSRRRFGAAFSAITPEQRTTLLNALDKEQRDYTPRKPGDPPVHYFLLMKQLTLLGYFTSEIGCTRALRYVETPGAYDGNVPYHKGDRAWVNPSHRAG